MPALISPGQPSVTVKVPVPTPMPAQQPKSAPQQSQPQSTTSQQPAQPSPTFRRVGSTPHSLILPGI